MPTNLDNYDIIGRFSKDSAFYKIKNKLTSEICIWKAIGYETFTKEQLNLILEKIEKRKCLKHPNLVQIYNHIICEDTKTLYIVTNCCKYGSLKDVIGRCVQESELLDEDFIWRAVYHMACILKLTGYKGNLNVENVFLDVNYTIKLYCFDTEIKRCVNFKEKIVTSLGLLLYQLCTLQSCISNKIDFNSSNFHYIYSQELKRLIVLLCNNIDATLDSILCHPMVLLKLTNTPSKNIFIKIPCDTVKCESIENYQVCLKFLKSKEAALKLREQQLDVREQCLEKREKIITTMECTAREKIAQYLKKCSDMKMVRNGKRNSTCRSKQLYFPDSNMSVDNDSSTIPTTVKLDMKYIVRPSNFARTMSERRIRFKGHSPLKDIKNINHFSMEPHTSKGTQLERNMNSNFENTTIVKHKRISLGPFLKKSRKLFGKEVAPHEASSEKESKCIIQECRPVSWTEESKKNAFSLLRVMNSIECDKKVLDAQIKHTCL